MSEQCVDQIRFDFFPRLPIVVEAKDVQVSSDAGILPLRQFDSQIGFTKRFIDCLEDPRDLDQIEHTFAEMVRQRIFGILAGYEDCNDHDTLRSDPVFKIVADRNPEDKKEALIPFTWSNLSPEGPVSPSEQSNLDHGSRRPFS